MNTRKAFYIAILITSCLASSFSQSSQLSIEKVRELIQASFNFDQLSQDSAVNLLDDCEVVCLEEGDTCLLVRVLSERALQFSSTSSQDLALQNIQEAARMFELSQCDPGLEIYIDQSRVDLEQGLVNAKSMSDLARNSLKKYRHDPYDSTVYMRFILSALCETCDSTVSLRYLDTLYQYALKKKDLILQQKVWINRGAVYAWAGDYGKAKYYFNKAVKYKSDPTQISHLGTLFNNLAGLSDATEDVLRYIDSAIYYAKATNELDELRTYIENKAMYYTMIDEYEEAYRYIYHAMALSDSLLSEEKIIAIAEMQEKYEAEKKSNEIKGLKLENLQAESRFHKNRNRLLVGVFILLSLAGFLATRYYTINKHRNVLKEKNLELSIAHERSDQLLLNILPEEVANELKIKGQSEAKLYDMATIMFSDFIDFTKEVAELSSETLLEELNFYFRAFDETIEKYKVEKIKTIGDSYMAVGGLPVPFEESVKNTVLAALEMQKVVEERYVKNMGESKPAFKMRIGVHTGPIVAGIVGVKKFQYDVWGDAVNTASRLENTSESGKVNISYTTYEYIKDEPEFKFEYRGEIMAKGKGKLGMYFVTLA